MSHPPRIEVIRATPADWPLYRDVRLASLRDAPEAFGATLERALTFGRDDWRAGLEPPSWLAREVAADGTAGAGVGMVRLTTDDGRRHLSSMWVAPAARGRGLAERLVATLEAEAVALGERRLLLRVVQDNVRAIRLYERCGYSPTGARVTTSRGATEIEMAKDLRAAEPAAPGAPDPLRP